MITEVLLVLPLYLILFFVCLQFRHLIKIMADVGDILNDDELFGDVVDTPEKGIEQDKNREELKSAIDRGKLYKWTHETVDKASDKTIRKTYAEYRQREVNEKVEKTGKALGRHVISLYSSRIYRMVKIRDVHKLCQDIENDPTIKDQMAGLGCVLVLTFGNLLAPILVAVHTVNNLDHGDEPENVGYESKPSPEA